MEMPTFVRKDIHTVLSVSNTCCQRDITHCYYKVQTDCCLRLFVVAIS